MHLPKKPTEFFEEKGLEVPDGFDVSNVIIYLKTKKRWGLKG